ncbi:MAG: Trk system potassium transporter TrkA [Rhodospirillaceae bacterium]|jgi:trk system potassium uptake protein TrkA|nr:Trk system potassium transporter TrkA [Rhodospirillaceae bacterium]MBT3809099.1 Trk system potassium transporter TrkA [Rhodospirillaceae bacterium]MBT3932489.1 Trk system potassium transporter TrkA [Rhodospirillaceae bacterium]MBT4771362.1 Trk system potassium transporter TrkA [Rhodospirillaceae bacterium]MBT5359128.1 Trk system potassium transporter TrkA [Rhodospirillaceae bacterium]
MKAIICGGGQVGSSIARELASERVDVTVIDQSPELIRRIRDTLDVTTMVGFASHPDVLEAAGARDADMIVAVTFADEVNMIACQVAHSLFDVPMKIARVRSQAYRNPIWADLFSRDHMPIDVIISPEIEVARAISRRFTVPGSFEMIPLANNRLRLIGVRCEENCPILNTPLRQLTTLFPDLRLSIVGIIREGKPMVPTGDDHLEPGDEVYIVIDAEHVPRAMAAFGHEEQEARRVIIIGGGNIGQSLAADIEERFSGITARVIELNKERAEQAANTLSKTNVIHGDALDPDILAEAGVSKASTVVAITNDDEVNILASLLAKRYGAERAVTLVNSNTYNPLLAPLGIDVVVNPRVITVSTILQIIRRGRIRSVHSIGENFGEVIEAEALETSSLVGKAIKDAKLPAGVIVASILRDDQVLMATKETVINVGDRIVLFATKDAVRKVERMFAVRLEFF